MKCGVCKTPLVKIGHRTKAYRDQHGRVYKTIRHPRYAPCPNLDDPDMHPARRRKAGAGAAA